MSYLKIPLILANLIAADQQVTPPNPPPNSHELTNFTLRDPFTTIIVKIIPTVARTLTWLVGFGEISLIIAANHPSHFISQILLSLLPVPSGAPLIRITTSYIVASISIILSNIIRQSTYRTLGRMFTYELAIRDNHKLVTSGPYAYVRHPSYTALLLFSFGARSAFFSRGTFYHEVCGFDGTLLGWVGQIGSYVAIMLTALMFYLRVGVEDEMLRKKFEGEWEEWAKKVPYKLVPWIC